MRIRDWSSDVCSSDLTGWGFCLLKGFPVHRWSEDETRLAYWGMGLHMGVARPQNKNSAILNDVGNARGTYYGKDARGYNNNGSEERLVGQECVRRCSSRCSQYH